jgi:hypothetical protein
MSGLTTSFVTIPSIRTFGFASAGRKNISTAHFKRSVTEATGPRRQRFCVTLLPTNSLTAAIVAICVLAEATCHGKDANKAKERKFIFSCELRALIVASQRFSGMKMKTAGAEHEEIQPISQVFEQDDFGADCGRPKSNHDGAPGASSRLQRHAGTAPFCRYQ